MNFIFLLFNTVEMSHTLHKSRSYPERLRDAHERNIQNSINVHIDTIQTLKQKDYDRTERLANLGSPSSHDVVVRTSWKAKLCNSISRYINYFLEREEETKRNDEIIQRKSYAGFYYFIKWFIRAMFFLVFTTLGTIAGKEIGCLIKDHDVCQSGVVELADSSPHIVASIVGFIFGLLIGQSLGRIIWDRLTVSIRHCLRTVEKWADKTKIYLLLLSMVVYVVVTTVFAVIFWLFVDIGQDRENLIGATVGGFTGLVLAILAYKKSSKCVYNQSSETPLHTTTTTFASDPPNLQI